MAKIKNEIVTEIIDGFNERIDKGIAYLDRQMPRAKWLKKLNIEKLNLRDTYTCVLGQAFGDYWSKVARLDSGNSGMSYEDSIARGFNVGGTDKGIDLLTLCWYYRLAALKKKI